MSFISKLIAIALAIAVPFTGYSLYQKNTDLCGVVFNVEKYNLVQSIDQSTLGKLSSTRSLSKADVCSMPAALLAKSLKRLAFPKPDHPGEAASFRYQQQVSEGGNFNAKNWLASHERVKQARLREKKTGGISRNNWQSLGPGNIGGRIRSLAFDPDDSTRIYAGAVAGGVWLTENSGASWQPTDDFMGNLSVSTLVVDPNNSNVIYAGTGEGTFNADQVRGLGIFKSTDKAGSWTQLSSTNDDFDFYWVNRLTMLPDSSKLVAATHTGIWVSSDDGVSWTRQYSGRSFDVDAHPTDSTKLVAGIAGEALYSDDGGATWDVATGLSAGTGRVEIAYSKGTPSIVYASVNVNSGEIWKSTDGGQSYSQVNTGESYLGSQGWYDNALWVDPFDSDHVIVGGIDLWRSTDGGVNLTKISTWWKAPNSAHADHHFILEHPDYDGTTNKQVFFANDGGVYTTPDVTVALDNVGWQELNNELTITQFYGMGVAPDGTLVAGTQDNGTLVYKGDSEGWTTTFGGDGGYSAADPTDSNYLYGEYVYLRIHRSTNGGNGSSYIYGSGMDTNANFIAPFILDPNDPNRMLGGSDQLWLSENVKASTPTWTSIKSAMGSNISAIAVAAGDSDTIYVGHNDGSLFKTSNGTDLIPIWTDITGVDLPSRYLMRIAIDPQNNDTVYVSFGGYNSNNLWKSTDGGANWSNTTGSDPSNLPSAPVRTIAIKPDDSNLIYVGTEVGIFASEDAGQNWSLENDGPANVSVDELVWGDNNTLYAASHGRGIYKTEIAGLIFDAVLDAPRGSEQISNTQTVTGVSTDTPISIVGGEHSIGCDGSFSSANAIVNEGDTICLRHTASSEYWTYTTTTLTMGSRDFEFSSRTEPDTTPDEVTFTPLVDVDLGAVQTSNVVTIAGITNQADISVSGGEYSIGCTSSFTDVASTINLDDTLCLRHTAAILNFGVVTTTVTVGESSFEFTSTTLPDTTPDAFSFAEVDGVLINSIQTSASATITGIQVAVPVTVTNGEYSIGCTSTFTGDEGEISPEQSVCVRHNAAADYLTSNTTTLTVGGVDGDFVSTTSADITPDAFSFTSVSNAETSTELTSDTVTINGIAVAVDISISNGEYSIGCTSTFTSAAGTINNGESVCVKHTSASGFTAQTQTTLSVGRGSGAFTSTTKAAPPPTSSSGGGALGSSLLLLLILGLRRKF